MWFIVYITPPINHNVHWLAKVEFLVYWAVLLKGHYMVWSYFANVIPRVNQIWPVAHTFHVTNSSRY